MAKETIENATPAVVPEVTPTVNSSNSFAASVSLSVSQGLKVLALTVGLGIFGYISIKITNKLTRVRDKKVEISDK